MSTHQEQAERLYEDVGGCCSAEHLQHWCEKCQNKISLIQAALDAAARTALEEAARDMESTDRWAAKWLRAEAAEALSAREQAIRERLQTKTVELRQQVTALREALRDYLEWGAMTGSDRHMFEERFKTLLSASLPPAPATLGQSHSVTARERAEAEMGAYPIPLNDAQEKAALEWAADDRLWTTQETVEFNLRVFARVILSALPPAPEGK